MSEAPPSTSISYPMIQFASSEQSRATAFPTSAGVPSASTRPCATRGFRPERQKAGYWLFRTLSSIQPGGEVASQHFHRGLRGSHGHPWLPASEPPPSADFSSKWKRSSAPSTFL
jgi:hypothetical protein